MKTVEKAFTRSVAMHKIQNFQFYQIANNICNVKHTNLMNKGRYSIKQANEKNQYLHKIKTDEQMKRKHQTIHKRGGNKKNVLAK